MPSNSTGTITSVVDANMVIFRGGCTIGGFDCWTDAKNGVDGSGAITLNTTAQSQARGIGVDDDPNGNYVQIRRSYFVFDTSAITTASVVTGAEYSFFIPAGTVTAGGVYKLVKLSDNTTGSYNGGSPVAFSSDDFNAFDGVSTPTDSFAGQSTDYSDAFTGLTAATYNSVTLTQNALDDMVANDEIKFAMIEYTYDYTDNNPRDAGLDGFMTVGTFYSESTDANKRPKIDYSLFTPDTQGTDDVSTFAYALSNGRSLAFGEGETFSPFSDASYTSPDFTEHTNVVVFDSSDTATGRGSFTVTRSGSYMAVFVARVGSNDAERNVVTSRIKLNSTPQITAQFGVDSSLGQVERTSHAVLKDLAADDVITFDLSVTGDLQSDAITSRAGTAAFIYYLDEGYGNLHITAETTPASTAEYNPFDATTAPGSGATIVKTYDDGGRVVEAPSANSGSLKVSQTSRAFTVANLYSTSAEVSDHSVDNYVKKNGTPLSYQRVRLDLQQDSVESTLVAMDEHSTNDTFFTTMDGVLSNDIKTSAGSSFSVIEVPSVANFASVGLLNNTDQVTALNVLNPFDEDYSSTWGVNAASSSVMYDSGSGRFYLGRDGNYAMVLSALYNVGGDTEVGLSVRKNGTSVYTFDQTFDSDTDPQEQTNIILFNSASGGDYIDVFTSASAADHFLRAGTSVFMFELTGTLYVPPPPPTPPSEAVTGSFYSPEYVINTYADLSAQYDKAVAQVPFALGTPGPGRLRLLSKAPVISTGNKKN